MGQVSTETDSFVPGSFWTPERARTAQTAMAAVLATPEMQAMIDGAADHATETFTDMTPQQPRTPTGEIDGTRVTFRRGRPSDVPRFAELIAGADLPPLFIGEWIGGFAAAEYDGEVIACGGLEVYDDCGVIRSVVVDERGRGLRLGRALAGLLIDDGRAAGVTDMYLVTADAWPFWQHLGFADVTFEDWKEPARACWQYVYLATHREFFDSFGGRSMWKRV
jgi:N-acetylglutamate synthase-like GNAT family acetyltransferase